jgi:Ser/Thr protein kinase RdoA (MazF antagonist)
VTVLFRYGCAVTERAEHVLTGGNVSTGVVRIGDTVRKPAGPHTAAVEAFLSYLNAAGFSGAPKTLGRDDLGRHVLEYVPGEIADDLPPMDLGGLHRVGRLIRELHDISEGFRPPPEAQWDSAVLPDRADLICHHDLARWNLVCAGDRWVFIDWDAAAPGSRLWDLAWSMTSFVPLDPGGDPECDAKRVRALADGYGLTAQQRLELPPLIGAHSRAMFDLLRTSSLTGRQPWARLYAEGHGDYWGPAAEYADRHVEAWARALR